MGRKHAWFFRAKDRFDKRPHISVRESQILDLLADGANNGEIAHGLGIARTTAQQHIASFRDKLRARTRAHIIERAISYELIHPRSGSELSFIQECFFRGDEIEKARLSYIDGNSCQDYPKFSSLLNGDSRKLVESSGIDKVAYKALQDNSRQYFVDKKVVFPQSGQKITAEGWIDPLPERRTIVRLFY